MVLSAGATNPQGGVTALIFTRKPGTGVKLNDAEQPVLVEDEPLLATLSTQVQAAVAAVSPLPPLSPVGNDGANITTALQTGSVQLVSGATYNIASAIVLTGLSDRVLDLNGAILVGAFTGPLTVADSIIFGQSVNAPLAGTTLNGNAVVGANTLVVTSAANIQPGDLIKVTAALSANLVAHYRVLSKAVNTLTLDRPILMPFVNADVVVTQLTRPERIVILGKGAKITGNSFAAIDILAASHVSVVGPIDADFELGVGPLRGFVLDLGSVESKMSMLYINGYDSVSNTDLSDYGIAMFAAERCAAVDCRGEHCSIAGLVMFDGYASRMTRCDGYSCGTPSASGMAVGTGAAAATQNGCVDCVYDTISASNSVFGVAVAQATRCVWKDVQSLNCSTRNLDVGGGATTPSDCVFDRFSVGDGAPTTAAVLLNATVVRPVLKNFKFFGVTGAAGLVSVACDCRFEGLASDATNLCVGSLFVATGTGDSYFSGFDMTMKTINANANCVLLNAATGRMYLRNIRINLGVAADIAIQQASNNVVELDDVMVTNPNAVGATVGFISSGGSGVLRRKGRVDFSAAATPLTCVQTDQGTFTTNGATPVTVPFADMRATTGGGVAPVSLTGGQVQTWMVTAAGTPAPDQTVAVTANTGFTSTGKAADTSVRAFKVLD